MHRREALAVLQGAATDTSDLVIVDATDLAAPPVATIHLPVRVPYGFHGNWLADQTSTNGRLPSHV